MFMLFVAFAVVILSGLSQLMYLHGEKQEWRDNTFRFWSIALLVVAFILPCGGVVGTLVSYSDQISDTEDITKFENIEGVYEDRADTLTAQFETYLRDVYPEHERGIFDQISPDSIDIYLAKYPEIRWISTQRISTILPAPRVSQASEIHFWSMYLSTRIWRWAYPDF